MERWTAVDVHRILTTFTYNSVFFLVSSLVVKSIYCFPLTPDGPIRSVGLVSSPSSRKRRKQITTRKNSCYRLVHTLLVSTDGQKTYCPVIKRLDRPPRHISVVFHTAQLLKTCYNPSYFSILNPIIMYSRFQLSIRSSLIVYYCNTVRSNLIKLYKIRIYQY